MEGLGPVIILLACPVQEFPGCALQGGLGRRRLVGRYCSLYMSEHNSLGGMLCYLRSVNGGG